MLNEARDPVTQRKAQSDQYYSLTFFLFFLFFYAKVIPPTSQIDNSTQAMRVCVETEPTRFEKS
jgi:hypothetical protein